MDTFTTLTAVACPLGLANVDTDQLIPARFMRRSRAEGYGPVLLYDLRYGTDTAPYADCVIDSARYVGAGILVARRNFGCGSSREAAVYALLDFGIRCVIAPSFGDIFATNAVKNGLLPAIAREADVETLLHHLAQSERPKLTVDLAQQTIAADGLTCPFVVDAARKLQLLNGWDDLDLTLQYAKMIADYRADRMAMYPFALPNGS
jgi:3-isopropylmalate/(R)-2-methylmalate dehydratase small subunit